MISANRRIRPTRLDRCMCRTSGLTTVAVIIDMLVGLTLVGVLTGVYLYDEGAANPPPPNEPIEEPDFDGPIPPPPEILPPPSSLQPIDSVPRVALQFLRNDRFGVVTTSGNPDDPSDDNQRLTYSRNGETNNTRFTIDARQPDLKELQIVSSNRLVENGAYEAEWRDGDVQIKRNIRLVAGETSRRFDQIEVAYTITNSGQSQHTIGLREMLDTLIGANDGVPFIVPGQDGLVNSVTSYGGNQVPDLVLALERPDLTDPGVIVEIGLRARQSERPIEVVLSHWPGSNAIWNYDRNRPIGSDSAIGIFYEIRTLSPGESRYLAYSYGLGTISSTRTKNAKLSLSANGPFHAAGKFWLTVLVQNPRNGQQVRVCLPDGMAFAAEHSETKPVMENDAGFTQLSWLIQISRNCVGIRELDVSLTPDGATERQTISIQPPEARLTLLSRHAAAGGSTLWISALVRNPKQGQTVELSMPNDIILMKDHTHRKPVPTDGDVVQVNWLVRAGSRNNGQVQFRVKLNPDGIEDTCEINIEPSSLIR